MAGKQEGRSRRELANNPGNHPLQRAYQKQLNADVSWEATSTTTTTTTTTVAATTTGA